MPSRLKLLARPAAMIAVAGITLIASSIATAAPAYASARHCATAAHSNPSTCIEVIGDGKWVYEVRVGVALDPRSSATGYWAVWGTHENYNTPRKEMYNGNWAFVMSVWAPEFNVSDERVRGEYANGHLICAQWHEDPNDGRGGVACITIRS